MADATTSTYPEAPLGRPEGRYSTGQIAAHWTVVFLILFQYATGDAMSAAYRQGVAQGVLPPDGILVVHGLIGSSILAAMLWRLALRFRYGAPPPPETLSRPLQIVSRAVHYAFYVALIGMPLFGMAALWLKIGILGTLHALTAYVVVGLAVAHVAGALYHIWKRDGTIGRITRGQSMP